MAGQTFGPLLPTLEEIHSYRPRIFVPCSVPLGSTFADQYILSNCTCVDCDVIRTLILSSDGAGSEWTPFDMLSDEEKEPMRQQSQFWRYVGVTSSLKSRSVCMLEMSASEGCHICSLLLQLAISGCNRHEKQPLHLCAYYGADDELTFELAMGNLENYQTQQRFLTIYASDEECDPKATSLSITSASSKGMDWVRAKLDKCLRHHAKCRPGAKEKLTKLPSRLIHLSGDVATREIVPQLVDSVAVDAETAYATLSYCWGDAPSFLLTKDREAEFRQQMPFKQLPKTCRDAMKICQHIGLSYIWIDALCIIQDSDDDRLREIQNMHSVYRSGTICIAALDAVDSSQGCFGYRNPLMRQPCTLGRRAGGQIMMIANSHEIDYAMLSPLFKSALCSRGWIVQERLLSPRTVYFGECIFWECREATAHELGQGTMVPGRKLDSDALDCEPRGSDCTEIQCTLLNGEDHHISFIAMTAFAVWRDILDNYNHATLRYRGDTLAAIIGVAQYISNATGLTYFAGLWAEADIVIPHQLLWHWKSPIKNGRRIASTWSVFSNGLLWPTAAPVNGPAISSYCERRFLCSAASLRCERTEYAERQLCQFGELHLSGSLFELSCMQNEAEIDENEVSTGNTMIIADLDAHINRDAVWTSTYIDYILDIRPTDGPAADMISGSKDRLFFFPILLTRQNEFNPYMVCHGLILMKGQTAALFDVYLEAKTVDSQDSPSSVRRQESENTFCRVGVTSFDVSNINIPILQDLVRQHRTDPIILL